MRKEFWWLVLIIIIAALFRFLYLPSTPPGLYPDEAINGTNAQEALHTGTFKIFYPENNGREGLFINIQAVFLRVIQQNEPWVLRLPSAIFGLLTVVGLYFLVRELFDSRVLGLLASYFTAISFWHINFSRIAFRAIMSPFFLVWAVYLLILSFRKLGVESPSGQPRSIIGDLGLWSVPLIGGALYALGLYSYIAYRATPLLILFILGYYFVRSRRKWHGNFWAVTAVFLIAAFLTALPIGAYFLKNPSSFFGRTSEISIFSSSSPIASLAVNTLKTAGMFVIAGDSNWRQNYAGKPEFSPLLGLFLLIGVGICLYGLYRRDFKQWLIAAWALVAALPVVISNEGIPHALRSILLIPPAIILAAIGAEYLYKWIKQYARIPAKHMFVLALIVFAVMGAETYFTYFYLWAGNAATADSFNSNYVTLAREINALPPDQTKVLVVYAGGVDVRGLPMSTQTVMFMTDSFYGTVEKSLGIFFNQAKNIYYVYPDEIKTMSLPPQIFVAGID